jgi:hypothetical protein
MALLLQSLALIVGCLLTAVACRRIIPVVALAVMALLAGLPQGIEYFSSRLDFSGGVLNLSNLVYVQGWELVQESFGRSAGWGVGFQQLGLRGTDVAAAELIRAITGAEDENLTDGGFVFSKIASEFGVAGVLFSILYVVAAAQSIRALRVGGGRSAITVARCIVVAYGVDMFVRGTGYFVESTLLFVAASTTLMINRGLSVVRWAIKPHLRREVDPRRPYATDKLI